AQTPARGGQALLHRAPRAGLQHAARAGRSRPAGGPSRQPRGSRESCAASGDSPAAAAWHLHGAVAGAVDRRRHHRRRLHVPDRMRTLLLAALWTHLASSVLLVGAFSMLLLAGLPREPTARRWTEQIVRGGRWLVMVAMGSGLVWLLSRTAIFENRPHAALE